VARAFVVVAAMQRRRRRWFDAAANVAATVERLHYEQKRVETTPR
jgi:hypothetical protein